MEPVISLDYLLSDISAAVGTPAQFAGFEQYLVKRTTPCDGCRYADRCGKEKLACSDFVSWTEREVFTGEERSPTRDAYDFVYELGKYADLNPERRNLLSVYFQLGLSDTLDTWAFSSTAPTNTEMRDFLKFLRRNFGHVTVRQMIAALHAHHLTNIPSPRVIEKWVQARLVYDRV